jgi:adenine-specific DNA-methyltransferase
LFFYSQIASQIRGGYYRFYTQYVEQIPIPKVSNDLRQQIASLAQQCLDAAKDNPDTLPALEAELNQLVYQAYGLDEDDIRVIEGHLSGTNQVIQLNIDDME